MSPAATPPVLLLDTASLYYRSYFALPESMTAPDGHPHNAIRGFLSTITRLVTAYRPSGLVACWDDDWRPDWRVQLLPSYKAHRVADDAQGAEDEPETLGPQVDGIALILDALGLARVGMAQHEADDVIASFAHQIDGATIVVSGDRDLVQLVDDATSLLLTVNGGMEKWPLLNRDAVRDRFGVWPEQYVDLAVLRGDPSDGLPGVPGIGAKTATALIQAFGGVDEIIGAAATPVKPLTPRLAAAVTENAQYIRQAFTVATAVRDLPLPPVSWRLTDAVCDEGEVNRLAQVWGVRRQVDDLRKALAQPA